MVARLPAVAQDVLVRAASVFQGVGQDRQAVEGAVGVDGLGEAGDGRREPFALGGDRLEGVAKDAGENVFLFLLRQVRFQPVPPTVPITRLVFDYFLCCYSDSVCSFSTWPCGFSCVPLQKPQSSVRQSLLHRQTTQQQLRLVGLL